MKALWQVQTLRVLEKLYGYMGSVAAGIVHVAHREVKVYNSHHSAKLQAFSHL